MVGLFFFFSFGRLLLKFCQLEQQIFSYYVHVLTSVGS